MTTAANMIRIVAIADGQPADAPAHALHYGLVVIALVALSAVRLAPLRGRHDVKPAGQPKQHPPGILIADGFVVPTALVSSAAAAGVHAAMGPPHFREGILFGLFFAFVAILQLTWAALLMARRSDALLVLGVLGNVTVIAVWAVSRTVGLPLGLLAEPETMGVWDLACVTWEVIVVGCCVLLLRSRSVSGQLSSWRDWRRSAQVYAGGSLVLLVALGATGG